MKKTLMAATFMLLLLLPFFVSSVIADDVTITIKGGLGCTVTIQNNGNETINASISIVSNRIFGEGGANTTGQGPVYPHTSYGARLTAPGLQSIYAMGQVGNLTVTRNGISFFRLVFLFKE